MTGIEDYFAKSGDAHVDKFFFFHHFANGCDSHPDLEKHGLIGVELTGFLKQKMGW